MKFSNAILAVLIPFLLSACKVQIEVPEGGSITTSSGSINCAAGNVCSFDVTDVNFDEQFIAVPEEGFVFSGWSTKHRSFCGGKVDTCHLATSGFSGNQALINFLSKDDEVFYLAPTFKRTSTGFNSLFIGHSFFIPIANTMPLHTEIAGVSYHTQETVFSGGSGGAPEALWNDQSKSEEIRAVLDAGGVDFFAMTYHPDYPELTGYTNWIDYALEQNSDAHIAIGLPWTPGPENYDSVGYRSYFEEFHAATFHPLIDELRALYPNTDIYCIPYGAGAVELRDLYSAGTLDDVEALVSDSVDSIYNDSLGHADDILYSVVELVWLNAIYGVDLSTYSYDPGYITDVKAIAEKVMDEHDPAYDAPYL